MSQLRLDRIICDSGMATRSCSKKLIASGRVRVDGKVVTDPGFKADADASEISVDGRAIRSGFRYLMMNKPDGALSATEDRTLNTVIDLLPEEYRDMGLFPVGRLDRDTTGLIILTNDGDFCHRVTSPRHHVNKTYEMNVDGILDAGDVEAFAAGLILRDGTCCLPASLVIDEENASHGFIIVSEGKYHQVKRMLASRGKPVMTLRRVAVGELRLDPALRPGAFRELTENELNLIVNRNVTK